MDLTIFSSVELISLGRLDLEQNKLDTALAKIKTALQQEDCPPEASAIAARIYAQLKLFEQAKSHYVSFLDVEPKALMERFQLGMVNFETGDQETALDIWRNILEANPTHPPCLYYSAIACLQLGAKEDAERHLQILLQSAPADNLYFGRAKELVQNLNIPTPAQAKTSDLYQ